MPYARPAYAQPTGTTLNQADILRNQQRSTLLFFTISGFFFGNWAVRIPAMSTALGLSEGALGVALFFGATGSVLAMILCPLVIKIKGSLWVTRATLLVGILIYPFIGFAQTSWMFSTFLFVAFFGLGGMDMTMNALGVAVERATAKPIMSRLHGFFSVGAGLGACVGAVASFAGLTPGVHFLMVAVFVAIVWTLFDRATEPETAETETTKFGFSFPTLRLLSIALIAGVAFMFEGVISDWSGLFLADFYAVTESVAASGLVAFSIAMIAARFSGDRVIDRFGPTKVAFAAFLTVVTGGLLISLAPTITVAVIGFFICGMGFAPLAPIAMTGAGTVRSMPTEQAIAYVSVLGYGGLLAGPPLMGFLAEATSLRACFVAMTIVAFASLPLVFAARLNIGQDLP